VPRKGVSRERPFDSRIKFAGNPWPDGHAIKTAEWTAVVDPRGLWFHFHVESADYSAENDSDDNTEPESDWKARGVWNNYHACFLSSTKWGHQGVLAAKPGKPLDLDKLEGKVFRADTEHENLAGVNRDDLAFGIYLLGHDSVAHHRIRFVKRRAPWTYDVQWKAKIALTYVGHTDFAHTLEATLPALKLERIELDDVDDTQIASVIANAGKLARRGNTLKR
jgi:hypothetical protein